MGRQAWRLPLSLVEEQRAALAAPLLFLLQMSHAKRGPTAATPVSVLGQAF